jgi:hypothetical protein
MFTRQHYKMLAALVEQLRKETPSELLGFNLDDKRIVITIEDLKLALVAMLAADNSRFNREKFLQASRGKE